MKKVDSLFLVRLHWRIQNISCTLNVPMFYSSQFSLTVNFQDGGGGSPLKIRLLWQASEMLLKSLECRFLVPHGSNTSFETGAPL